MNNTVIGGQCKDKPMSILNESLAGQIRGGASEQGAHDTSFRVPVDGVSYVKGAREPGLDYMTIPQLLRRAVSRFGPREAVVFTDTGLRRSYYDFDRDIDALATGLLALGLQKGHRVGI